MKNTSIKPNFAATALSCVPYRDTAHCVQVILENFPEAPFLPVLTRSLRYQLEGFPCIVFNREKREITMAQPEEREEELLEFYDRVEQGDLDYFAITPEAAPAHQLMIDALKQNSLPDLKWVLFQILSPVTFGDIIKQQANGRSCMFHETLMDVIVKGTNMKCRWLEAKLKQELPGIEVIINQPQPTLVNFTSAGGTGTRGNMLSLINAGIAGLSGLTFTHCCANADWSLLTDSNMDVINFDAYQHSLQASLYAKGFKKFLENGGSIGWGIVPTFAHLFEQENFESLVDRLEKGIAAFVKEGIDEELLASSSWVLPSCETAMLTTELSDEVFRMTRKISERMKSKYGVN